MPSIKRIDNEEIIKEMIGKVDKKRFAKLLAIAGSDSNDKKMPKQSVVDRYLLRWATAKADFYRLFGNSFKIEKEIKFEMDAVEMSSLIETLCCDYPKYVKNIKSFEPEEYIANKSCGDEEYEKYCPKFYKAGCKVSTFLHNLLEDNDFDIALSKVLQNKEITGKLAISIDPYDYLTMSLNAHDWNSCHNIKNGCYATGCFSYMCDEATLIAYKENGKEFNYKVNGFEFAGNSKSWRQCVYVDKDTCSLIFSRQYPDSIAEVSKDVRGFLEKTISDYFGLENTWVIKKKSFRGEYKRVSEFNYHDILEGYDFYFAEPKSVSEDADAKQKFLVGSEVECVYCGEVLSGARERVCDKCGGKKIAEDSDGIGW